MYSEMILEFSPGPSGELFCSGRAALLWLGRDEEEITINIRREDLCLRPPSGWEKEIFPRASSFPCEKSGPPLRGEVGTVWFWHQDQPQFVEVETDLQEERRFLELYPWAEEILRIYRPDALSTRFRLPAPCLSFCSEAIAIS